MVQLSHPYMTTGRTIALTIWTFAGKMICLLFITLSRFVMAFLPRSKRVLISWLQSPSMVILEPRKIRSVTASIFSPFISHEMMELDAMLLVFQCWVLSQHFHSPLSPSSWDSSVPLHFLPLEWYHLHIWGCWHSSWQSRASSKECTTLHCTWREQPTTQAYFVGYSRLCHLHKDK